MKKVLFFDYSNVIFRTINVAYVEGRPTEKRQKAILEETGQEAKTLTTDEIHDFWKHITLNTMLATIMREKPDEVVIGYDARGGYWRHDVYSDYKANRRESRDDSVVDFELFFPMADEFKKEFIAAYPNFKHMELDRCEADDIAGVLAKEYCNGQEIAFITNDKDYIQLLRYPNVRLYNPVDKKEVTSMNPLRDLDLKVITGDKGDNVPAIKPRTALKTAEKILSKGLDVFFAEQADPAVVEEAYRRNRTLIDLSNTPSDISSKIMTAYDSYETDKFSYNSNLVFLHKNKCNQLADDLIMRHCNILMRIGNK